MEYYQKISCPHCGKNHLGKAGKSTKGIQRYFCKNEACETHTFMMIYRDLTARQ
jgi:transposase-like protein